MINFKNRICYVLNSEWDIRNIWQPLILAFLGLLADIKLVGFEGMIPQLEVNFWYIVVPVIIYFIAVALYKYLSAPLCIENMKLKDGRTVSHRLDDRDISDLLGGYLIEDVFMYHANGGVQCCRYKGIEEIKSLKDSYDFFRIACPADSTAYIKIELFNGRKNIGKTATIHLVNSSGEEVKIKTNEIYNSNNRHPIILGDQSKLGIKLDYSDEFFVENDVELLISITSWRKQPLVDSP